MSFLNRSLVEISGLKLSFRLFSHSAKVFPKIIIKPGKSRLFKGSNPNPLVFSGAIEKVVGSAKAGDECVVVSTKMDGKVIGRGFFNPHSQYRVRLIIGDEAELLDMDLKAILKFRIKEAIRLRTSLKLGTLQSSSSSSSLSPSLIRTRTRTKSTTTYRLINSEGDRLSGLVVDVLGDEFIIVQSSAYWVEIHKDIILCALTEVLGTDRTILWRRADGRLQQDGYGESLIENEEDNCKEDVIVLENDIKFMVSPFGGQKTGFFCDQRNNRDMIRKLSENMSVLDAYCYSGGFSINAALGGAKNVIAIDSSESALDLAVKNMKLNDLDPSKITFIKGDAVKEMRKMATDGKTLLFDIVIVDPPKLAPSISSLERASKKYIQINHAAIQLVKPGGLLLSCSCSAAVTQSGRLSEFISDAAHQLGRSTTIVSTSNAAGDHPVLTSYKEGSYLTAILVCVQ